jgi:hypothetical protein
MKQYSVGCIGGFSLRKGLIGGACSAVALGLAAAAPSPAWAVPATFYLDQLSVELNGSQLFVDDFTDGNPPPSSPNYTAPFPAVSPGYTVFSQFPAGNDCSPASLCVFPSEANSRVTLSVSNGRPAETATGVPTAVQFAILRTPSDSALGTSINGNDRFKVSALYDNVNPNGLTEHYRVSVTDRVGPQGPGDTTRNVISLAVMRFGTFSDPTKVSCGTWGTSCATANNPGDPGKVFTDLFGQVAVVLYKQDFVNDTFVILEAHKVDSAGLPDQIRLTLEKPANVSTNIAASFTYVKNGVDGVTTTLATPAVGFEGGINFTRAEFAAIQATTLNTLAAAKLTTGSPASISQTISEVASSSLQFQYRFATTSGQLRVTLNGTDLGVIDAPSTLDSLFTTVSFDTSAFLGLLNAVLAFTLDGPTGSSMLLDNIAFANLANGDFQTGNLSAWTAVASGLGSAGVEITVQETPLPATLPLFATGLGVMGLLGWRRRRRAQTAA